MAGTPELDEVAVTLFLYNKNHQHVLFSTSIEVKYA